MELDQLKRLCQDSHDLLEHLRMEQNQIRKRLPSKPLCPVSLHNKTAPERSVPLPKRGKEAARVTSQCDSEKRPTHLSSWSVRPFLGYDWIAGILETSSSVTEKSDQYFAELQEFREANKDMCVHEQKLEPEPLDYTVPEQEPDLITSSHKCVYRYRLNQRLFTVPVDPEAACLVCKVPRAQQPPETLEEPAHVRVTIPKSTLTPPYKYKAHRRKSFDPSDSLSLPSQAHGQQPGPASFAGGEASAPSSPGENSLNLVSGGNRALLTRTHLLDLAACLSRGSKPKLGAAEQLHVEK